MQAILIILAGMAVSAFAYTLLTTWTVSTWQQQQREDVRRLAHEQLGEFATALASDLVANNADVFSDTGKRLLQATGERFLKSNKDILHVFMRDVQQTSGTIIISNDQGNIRLRELPTTDLESAIQEFSIPLQVKGQDAARLTLALHLGRIDARMEHTARQIKASLTSLSFFMLVILGATLTLLWIVFRRHLGLIQRNARLGEMAYVGTLAGGLAHEIRNPLHAMNINLQVVEEEMSDPREDSAPKVQRILSRLRGEVQELNQSLTRFLEYAKPERHVPERVDLRDLLAEICRGVRPSLEAFGGTLAFSLDPAFSAEAARGGASLTTASIRVGPIRQALTNVVSNAVQALESKAADAATAAGYEPRLTVHLAPTQGGKALAITIGDNGPGIPESQLDKIFDVFFSTRPGGSGFGLAIARRSFTDHRGRIWAESRLGEGATFKMLLPRDFEPR